MSAFLPEIAILPAQGVSTGIQTTSWIGYLPLIWVIGFSFAIIRLLAAALVLHRWRNQAVEVGRIDGVAICELRNLPGPVAAGVWRPVIFVPDSWNAWPDENQRIVLEHELAHHGRRDPLWRLFAELACAIHWYHPFVHWMKRRFIMQCECACDARVLGKGIDPKTYANVLCDFASHGSPSPLAPAMADTSSLESRVTRMLQPCRKLSGWSLAFFGLIGVATACSLSMIGRENPEPRVQIPAAEVELRWSADPFPAEP